MFCISLHLVALTVIWRQQRVSSAIQTAATPHLEAAPRHNKTRYHRIAGNGSVSTFSKSVYAVFCLVFSLAKFPYLISFSFIFFLCRCPRLFSSHYLFCSRLTKTQLFCAIERDCTHCPNRMCISVGQTFNFCTYEVRTAQVWFRQLMCQCTFLVSTHLIGLGRF